MLQRFAPLHHLIFSFKLLLMKQTMICLLLAAGMLACNAEKKEEPAAATIQEAGLETESLPISSELDTTGVETSRKVEEIDSLLEGI